MTGKRIVLLTLVLSLAACPYPEYNESSIDEGVICILDPQSSLHAGYLADSDTSPDDYYWGDYIGMIADTPVEERERQTYDSGEPLLVIWASPQMNDQCLQERTHGADTEREGTVVQINTWVEQVRQQTESSCITSASIVTDSATIEPFEQGTYELIFGETSYELQIPSESGVICLSSPLP